jgi:SAM-dependent methyltransferase
MFEEFKKYYDLDRGDCLVCNSTEHSLWAKHEYFKAIECSDCGFVYMNPSINPEGLNEFYTNYIGDRFQNQKKMDDREIQYEIDAAFVQGFLTQGKILDVGCNGGFFLSKLSNDFEKYGIEVDSEAVEYANKNYSYDIREGEIGEDNFEEESFDLIIFRGVIEHMLDPKKALDRSEKLLKKGGLIYFCATPNLKSFAANFYKEKWNLWHPIEHINIFDGSTLHLLLGKTKFSILAEDYQYLNTPYENWKNDYSVMIKDIENKANGKWDDVKRSKPFWGNMMSLIFRKN